MHDEVDPLGLTHEDRGRLASIVELTTDLVASFRLDGTCRWLNASAARALGATVPAEVALLRLVDATTLARIEAEVLPTVRRDGIWTGEIDLVIDARTLPLAANVIGDRGADGAVDGYTVIGHDLTDHRALAAELSHRATHDELTGIANRAHLAERLDGVASLPDLIVAFIDLDGFKEVNDTHGHHVGDLALIEVARRLATAIGPAGFVARYGGDEFVVLPDPRWADPVSELEARVFDAPVVVGELELPIRGAIGAVRRRAGEPPGDVLARADQAMYRAKTARRDPRHRVLVARAAAVALARTAPAGAGSADTNPADEGPAGPTPAAGG